MADPVLTPRMINSNRWIVYLHCDKCRMMTLFDWKDLYRRSPDLDMGEALTRGKFKCRRCKHPASGIDVSCQPHGRDLKVMKLTPGLTIVRYEEG